MPGSKGKLNKVLCYTAAADHGEGNGTPLQCSRLENPMDRGAWWAAVHGVRRVGHDWATSLPLFTFMHWTRKWQPTPVFLPGESQGREPGGLLSMASHRIRHDWRDLAAAVATAEWIQTCSHFGNECVCLQAHPILIKIKRCTLLLNHALLFLHCYFHNNSYVRLLFDRNIDWVILKLLVHNTGQFSKHSGERMSLLSRKKTDFNSLKTIPRVMSCPKISDFLFYFQLCLSLKDFVQIFDRLVAFMPVLIFFRPFICGDPVTFSMKQLKGKKTTHTKKNKSQKLGEKKRQNYLQKRNVPFGGNGTNVLIKEQS